MAASSMMFILGLAIPGSFEAVLLHCSYDAVPKLDNVIPAPKPGIEAIVERVVWSRRCWDAIVADRLRVAEHGEDALASEPCESDSVEKAMSCGGCFPTGGFE